MNNNEIVKNSYKYFLYSSLAWDNADRKVEDDPQNNIYFVTNKSKIDLCKDLNYTRKNKIIGVKYYENKATSTNYNVYEKSDKEVIIAFRGSDSKQDWISDFSFFKSKFKNENGALNAELSSEDFDKLIFEEYAKSTEGFFENVFNNAKLENGINDIKSNINNFTNGTLDFFKKFGNKANFHGGFLKQYMSVSKDIDLLVDKYMKDNRFNKITIVGHSLGSSLAQLAYIFQSFRNYNEKDKLSCYAYGTPKIGDLSLKMLINSSGISKNIHITNICDDIVCSLPPSKLGFYTNPNEIEITPIKAPFPTKCNHTLFYYLYCFKNGASIKIKSNV